MKGTNDGTPPDQPKKHLLAADSSIAPKACVGRVPSGSCEPPLAQDRHGHCKQKEELAVPRAVIGCKQRVITAAPRARSFTSHMAAMRTLLKIWSALILVKYQCGPDSA
ncbi:hypothetical protein PVAP13_7NG249417 [Panicum virgatum]|uniref:Uncharacterized protein n=1 Tax=Panicum virgatum TaxID=38727 RepID=A0A8T0Q238_PANVG|nr:hypothetical protein PVAP13_7NG249417 [Panicum virgatum]